MFCSRSIRKFFIFPEVRPELDLCQMQAAVQQQYEDDAAQQDQEALVAVHVSELQVRFS
jgi:hypothetical protein